LATANFTFTTLTGTETAGWNSINTLLTSIDTQLNTSNRLIYMSGWSAVAGQTIKWDAANSRWVPGTLDAAALANNSVTEAKIATDAVTSGKIAADAVGSSEIAAGAVTLAKISPAGSTAGQVLTSTGSGSDPSWQNASIGEANIADNAITQAKMADNSVGTAEIIDANVTYAKLGSTAKRYDVMTGGAGLVFTSSGNLSTTSASTNPTQQPLVVVDSSAGAVTLTLPTTGFSVIPGATITIAQTVGSNPVIIQPGTSVFINGSNSNTYTLAGLYSVVTLILIGTGNTWIITGDYI